MKFSVKKVNIKKILENDNKILEKSGNFVSPEKWEPCINPRKQFVRDSGSITGMRFTISGTQHM